MQVTAFNDMFSATVQGVAYEDLTSKWEPHLDWAYLRFQPLSSLSRAGDMRAPTFMYSDSVFIGYANSWIRTPLEVYRLTPVYQLRGVDVLWRQTFGNATVSLQPYYGESERKPVRMPRRSKCRNGTVSSPRSKSARCQRAGYSTLSLDEDQTDERLEPAIQALRGMAAMGCAPCAIDADALTIGGMEMDLLSVGAQYDNGKSVVIAEYAKRETGVLVTNDMSSAYLTVGHRFGGLMPYATYAIARRDGEQESALPSTNPLSAIVGGVTAATANDQDTQRRPALRRAELLGTEGCDRQAAVRPHQGEGRQRTVHQRAWLRR